MQTNNALFRSDTHKMLQRVKAVNMLTILPLSTLYLNYISAVPVYVRITAD